jgi:hypothetical protein
MDEKDKIIDELPLKEKIIYYGFIFVISAIYLYLAYRAIFCVFSKLCLD